MFKRILAALVAATLSTSPGLANTPKSPPLPNAANAPEIADMGQGVAIMGAIIEQNGNVFDGTGVVSATYDGAGVQYKIKFNRPLAGCFSTASAWNTGIGGLTATDAVDFNSDTAFVRLVDTSGNPQIGPFQIIVFCYR